MTIKVVVDRRSRLAPCRPLLTLDPSLSCRLGQSVWRASSLWAPAKRGGMRARMPTCFMVTLTGRSSSWSDLLQIQDDWAGCLGWRAEAGAHGALDAHLVSRDRFAALDAEPLRQIG